ncbi:hypothetical protein RYA07_28290, partial [Pseudomonas syringae pv. actinidiae]|nr:hypothetical protein [Pseudomonas syringae pv. actinidiae]
MKLHQPKISLRPKLKAYIWITGILLFFWIGFVLLAYFKAQERNMELRDIHSVTRWGIAAILGTLLLIYSGHWWGKAVAHEKIELVYRLKINFSHACVLIATRARWILF